MGKKRSLVFFVIVLVGLVLLFYAIIDYEEKVLDYKDISYGTVNLIDPEMAPEPQRQAVMHGFRIMQETKKYAPRYAGDEITCNNCHFDGGNTLGGKNNGIPLVGVSQKYPAFSKREGRVISLAERISNCFERSMNGKPVAQSAPEMQSLLAYFDWISSPVADYKERPWLEMKPLKVKYLGVSERGEKLYKEHCGICHGNDGQGGKTEEGNDVPPLWGDTAFNDAAGMSRPDTFASFIYWNMPFGQPFLSEAEAIDIASFVTKQPRPHYEPVK